MSAIKRYVCDTSIKGLDTRRRISRKFRHFLGYISMYTLQRCIGLGMIGVFVFCLTFFIYSDMGIKEALTRALLGVILGIVVVAWIGTAAYLVVTSGCPHLRSLC